MNNKLAKALAQNSAYVMVAFLIGLICLPTWHGWTLLLFLWVYVLTMAVYKAVVSPQT